MRKKLIRPYFQIFIVLLALISIPKNFSQKIKGVTIAALAPLWHLTGFNFNNKDSSDPLLEEVQKLKLENQLLSNEVSRLKEILKNEIHIAYQLEEASASKEAVEHLKKLRALDFNHLLSKQLQSIPAQVIFRSPSSWTSSFWINAGLSDNETLGKEVIAKNSPVVLGIAVVGVIDYVGKRQSRVRMITDSGLTPSVRVMREESGKTLFLAKGELRGSKETAFRNLSPILKGAGFNYDYPDEEGPARDLRTGAAASIINSEDNLPIIQTEDLLITTGMDGIFPKGLQVARVSKITPLKEGDYCYGIEAVSCVKNLNDLTSVYVLPPSDYDPAIRAPALW